MPSGFSTRSSFDYLRIALAILAVPLFVGAFCQGASLDIRGLESRRAFTDCLAGMSGFDAPRFQSESDLTEDALLALFRDQFGSSSAVVQVNKRRVGAQALNFQSCSPAADSSEVRRNQALVFLTRAFLRPRKEAVEQGGLAWHVEDEATDAFGNYILRVRQLLNGVPITGSTASVVISSGGIVQSVTARPILMRELDALSAIREVLTEQSALSSAKDWLAEDASPVASGEVVYRAADGLRPAWRFVFDEGASEEPSKISITVDKASGSTLELSNIGDINSPKFIAAPDDGYGRGTFDRRSFPTDCTPQPCRTAATREYAVKMGSQDVLRRVTVITSLAREGGLAQPLSAPAPDAFTSDDVWQRAAVDAYANAWSAVEALHGSFGLLPGPPSKLDSKLEVIVDNTSQTAASFTKGKIYLGRSPGAAMPAAVDQDIVAHEFVHFLIREYRRGATGLATVDAYNCKNPSHVQFPSIDESLADTIGMILGSVARDSARLPDVIGSQVLGDRSRSLKDPSKQSRFNKPALVQAYSTSGDQFRSVWKTQKYAQPKLFSDVINLPCSDRTDFDGLMYLNTGPLNALAYKLLNEFPVAYRPAKYQSDKNWLQLVGGVYLSVGSKLACESDDCDDFCTFVDKLANDFYTPLAPFGQQFVRRVQTFMRTEGFACN